MTDLHRFRAKPNCPGCEDQSKLKLRIEQLTQRFRKSEAKLTAVQDAYAAVNGQNAMIESLADCDPAEITVQFREPPGEDDNCVEEAQRETHTITFDGISGHKLKMLVMLLMESASLRLELELRDALQKAEQ